VTQRLEWFFDEVGCYLIVCIPKLELGNEIKIDTSKPAIKRVGVDFIVSVTFAFVNMALVLG
jgi:hypothetical protein